MQYKGGKGASGVHQQIINKMPKHKVYIETHLGGGNILLRKKPAECTIAIEIDTAVIKKFKRYSIVKNTDSTNIPPCSTCKYDGEISFVNEDCIKFLQSYNFTGDELIYVDPPYMFDTRKNKSKLYKYEYDTKDHIKLLEVLNSIKCFIMISGYQSDLYSEMLKKDKWHLFTFNAMTRAGVRTECLWCNFNPDDYIKHDYSYIGSNFRERERIKRKSNRWINNLNKLPQDERNFILSSIAKNFRLEVCYHL